MAINSRTVTVIGLGLMGSALASAFRRAGHGVTVWNRSPEKTVPFQGVAQIASSVADACAASDTVVVSVLNYDVSNALLRAPDVEGVIAGKSLVQLTTGTADEARDSQRWATQKAAAYLDGAITGYPRSIGTEHSTVLYSGDAPVFEAHRELLSALGGTAVFCGEEAGAAATLDLASLEFAYAQAAAMLHGAALCAAESVPLDLFFTVAEIPGWLLEFTTRHDFSDGRAPIDAASAASAMRRPRSYPNSVDATMVTHAAAIQQIARASREAGVDGSFPGSLYDCYRRAVARGHGLEDLPSLYEAFLPIEST